MCCMSMQPGETFFRASSMVALGAPLRVGLDRILQSRRGALIVIGDGPDILSVCSGGFPMDVEYTPQRLSELAKMDGAIIISADLEHIVRANVHLIPNPNVPTSETGTRHRTAERVARALDAIVIAVSESRKQIQLYTGEHVHQVMSPSRLLERANQALQTLQRYRARLDLTASKLSALEVEDRVTLRQVVEVLQRSEMVMRISTEIEQDLIELGTDARLVRLQLEEIMVGVEDDRRLLIIDYLHQDSEVASELAMESLARLSDEALFDDERLARTLKLMPKDGDLDEHRQPRGYRLLSKLTKVNEIHVKLVVERFGSLTKILGATTEDLEAIEGVGSSRAAIIKDGAARAAGGYILDLY